jgi:hypothetical protein
LASLGDSLPADPPQPLVDERTAPREDVLQSEQRLLPVFAPLRRQFDLDFYQAARAAAVAAALAVHTVRQRLEPVRGFSVAALAFTEGSCTVPAPESSAPNAD